MVLTIKVYMDIVIATAMVVMATVMATDVIMVIAMAITMKNTKVVENAENKIE